MSIEITIGGICEQDLDLFFLEEVVTNHAFRAWLLSEIQWPAAYNDLTFAGRSIKHVDGEVDLEFTFQDSTGRSARLFMENKITAGFQLYQLGRYEKRASNLLRSGIEHVAVALLAPQRYASGSLGTVSMIAYEDVMDWLEAQTPDARTPYKLRLVQTAIEKGAIGYNAVIDQTATSFWLDYWREIDRLAPELEMKKPEGKPSAASFAWFPCSLPGNLKLCHKLSKGYVDLHFPSLGNRVGELRAALAPMIELGWRVEKAERSAVVRIVVPPLNATGLLVSEQKAAVSEGIDAAKRLYDWARRNSARLIEIQGSLR